MNVALSSIRADLRFSQSDMVWMAKAYLAAFSSLRPSQKLVLGHPAPRVSCRSGRYGPNGRQWHLVIMEHVLGSGCARTPHGEHMGARISALKTAALTVSMTHEYAQTGIAMRHERALLSA